MKVHEFFIAFGVIILAVFLRIMPHTPNVAPITALALFGGAYLDKRIAIIVPLIAMFISDLFLGFHSTMPFVYLSFVLAGLIGMYLQKHKTVKNIFLGALFSSILFFFITNMGVWLVSGMYARDIKGLVSCFALAVPFFRNTIMGDLLFTGVFFAMFEFFKVMLLKKKLAYEKKSEARS